MCGLDYVCMSPSWRTSGDGIYWSAMWEVRCDRRNAVKVQRFNFGFRTDIIFRLFMDVG